MHQLWDKIFGYEQIINVELQIKNFNHVNLSEVILIVCQHVVLRNSRF